MSGRGHKFFTPNKLDADLQDMASPRWRSWCYWKPGEIKKLKRRFWKLCRLKSKQDIEREMIQNVSP